LLYLFHPFEAPVLRELLMAVVAQQATLTAPVDLLYLFAVPEVGTTFVDFPQFQHIWHEDIPASPEDQADGVSAATDLCSLYRLMPAETANRRVSYADQTEDPMIRTTVSESRR
jgi:hypothetical protein